MEEAVKVRYVPCRGQVPLPVGFRPGVREQGSWIDVSRWSESSRRSSWRSPGRRTARASGP